ncbi:hypothetical protein BC939DRAFT_72748 [Gamsiella multidivaricata]|uniref:uncharacterized protein n=1 Tax=Gamsiella multidivaricata TaxID=101098 RepID=UPI00221FE9C8|nr:uncharacterized protein BC939DRAFT_72748 [Gamsiella multidivaricata]KAI7828265.1 hypothetical protein BC939DRAFT_72748 [Gamsiella multidivaricata]
MGVTGLPKAIKDTKGTLAYDLQNKKVHVDVSSLYFGFLQTRTFKATFNRVAKEARAEARATTTTSASAASILTATATFLAVPTAPAAPAAPTALAVSTASAAQGALSAADASTSRRSGIKKRALSFSEAPSKRGKACSSYASEVQAAGVQHPALFIGPNGRLTPDRPGTTEQSQNYDYIAHDLNKIMSKHFSKSTTVLHFDGKASIQKSQERQDRAISLSNRIKTLEVRVDNAIGENSDSLAPLYKQYRNAYKTSKAALADIRNGLEILEWHTCECPFQADTYIAELYQADNNKDDLAIITADSDMMVYQGVREITVPVGKYRELTTYKKADLLESLDLACDRELLLASIVTKDDYSKALPWHGFQRNTKIIRETRTETGAGDESTMDAPGSKTTEAEIIKELIQEYLQRVRGGQKKGVDDYTHAISAFVQVREDYLDSATPSCTTHERIPGILQKLEKCKLQRRNMTRALRTNPPADTLTSDTSAGLAFSSLSSTACRRLDSR